MRLLLDTNIFLWCVLDNKKLTKAIKEIIENADETYVSSASIWEIAIKKSLGKIDGENILGDLAKAIPASGFLELPISAKHAAAVHGLSHFHRDPFDRLLIAQAILEPLNFLTADKQLLNYSHLVKVVKSGK